MRADEDGSEQQRTLWCGNISDQVTDEVLYELFLQAGPLESVRRPRDPNGRPKSFAFIVYKHECSVPYAVELFRGEKLFNRALNLSARSTLHHIPVLDTHVTEFTECLEDKSRSRKEVIDHRNDRSDRRRSDREKDNKEPKSWAELNALRGSLVNGHSTFNRDDLLGSSVNMRESKLQNSPAFMPDFNTLLQMSQQMMVPGILPFPGLPLPGMGPMGPLLGHSMYPSMQGGMSGGSEKDRSRPLHDHSMYPSMQAGMSGGKRNSPEKDRSRSSYHEGRGSRRDHPYQDNRPGNRHADNRRHSDNRFDHRRHDRGYSSSRSSHERERRDRRSR